MIATVTLNPAVDYTVSLTAPMKQGMVNRTAAERITPGGKGINVSVILHRLGIDTTLHGFLSGTTGGLIERVMDEMQIPSQWIMLPEDGSMNRINMKLMGEGQVTEINGIGVAPDAAAVALLLEQLGRYSADDVIVLAGSVPKGLPVTFYGQIMEQLTQSHVQFAVDAEGEALLCALPYHPLVIKPNLPELCSLFDVDEIQDEAELLHYAGRLQDMGARNVLLSLGGAGALLLAENGEAYRMAAPQGKAMSTVGAGDSMLAGFLAAYADGLAPIDCLRMGIAAGSATAFCEWLAERADILRCLSVLTEATTIQINET